MLFIKRWIATLLGAALFFAAARAMAQEPGAVWPPKSATDWFLFASFCGTILNTLLTAIAAQYPQATWAGDAAHLIGALPVVNVHGLTLGAQERVQLKRLTSAVQVPTSPSPSPSPPPPLKAA